MTKPAPPSLRLIDRVAGRLVAGVIAGVHRTSTPPPLWDDHIEEFKALHPFILAVWHGQFMLLPALPREDIPTRAMIALHRDAEAMAYALKRHDLDLIRGAGAGIRGKDRGGAQAFRGALASLAQGYTVAMTADVPPGPARICGMGIITLARISGRPILPVALASSRYVSLKTWSRMTLNLPGSKLGGSIGQPIRVPADASDADLEELRRTVERQLDIATVDAYGRAGVSPDRATPLHARDVSGAGMRPSGRLKLYRGMTRLIQPVAPMILRARARKGKEEPARQGERFGEASLPRPPGALLWIHAASVGETNAVLPLIDALLAARPKLNILLTTFTVTSARLAAARLPDRAVHQYLPLDAPALVARFLAHWKPDVGVFTESEIWPNLVLAAAERDVPLVIVNARMSKESFRKWRKRPSLALPIFSRFHTVLAQNKLFENFYGQLGSRRVMAVGNLKVDSPAPPVDQAVRAGLMSAIGARPLWLAASTHDDEELRVARAHLAIKPTVPRLLTIIAPRHPLRGSDIQRAVSGLGLIVKRRAAAEPITPDTDIYLADTLGEMGSFFALSPVTFMGKSLIPDGGGQNPIEAVRHASAVLTGPHWANFSDAVVALKQANGIIEVKDENALAREVHRLLTTPDDLDKLRNNALRAVDKMAGALPKTVETLLALLPDTPADEASRRAR
jgi:3-deoxy-D-manno-octulosonic-acid transferase